jgi:hypothetical protein
MRLPNYASADNSQEDPASELSCRAARTLIKIHF